MNALGTAVPVMHPVVARDRLARVCLGKDAALESLQSRVRRISRDHRRAEITILLRLYRLLGFLQHG